MSAGRLEIGESIHVSDVQSGLHSEILELLNLTINTCNNNSNSAYVCLKVYYSTGLNLFPWLLLQVLQELEKHPFVRH